AHALAQRFADGHGGLGAPSAQRIGAAEAELVDLDDVGDRALGAREAPERFESDRAADASALRSGELRLGEADGEQEEDIVLAERWIAREIDAQILRRPGGVQIDTERSCAGAGRVARRRAERVG